MYPTIYWGDLLQELREKHFLLQKEVADFLHISRQSYSNLETGRSQPTAEHIAALSYIYDINLLDYVRKCLPPNYVAEQAVYRAVQIERVQEVTEEQRLKNPGTPPKKRGRRRKYYRGNDPRLKDIPPDDIPVLPQRPVPKKRRAPSQFHNSTTMSSLDLLRSSKYPKSVRRNPPAEETSPPPECLSDKPGEEENP